MRLIKILFTACSVVLGYTAQAQISLASAFTDHMVLQQKMKAPIWGWGVPSEVIKIVSSWNVKDTVTVTVNSSGCWKTNIRTPQAGGPYRLKICGSSEIELKDILIGEVWLCSGQSNMEWSHLQAVFNKEQEIAAANHPNIRVFHVPRGNSKQLQNSCEANWEVFTPSSMKKVSAIGYYFARELMQKMDVPIGIISSAFGGSPAEPWVPKQFIMNHPLLSENIVKDSIYWPEAGVLYNQMIYPITPYALAGTIWYQGESNVGSKISHSYGLLMSKLIDSWRGAFNNAAMPFYFVQIAPFKYDAISDSLAVATLREQQELVASQIEHTGMVVINDLVDNISDVHPQNKLDVGLRLANMAMAKTYHLPIASYQSPTYKSVRFKEGKAYISFSNVVTDLEIRGKQAIGFMIAEAGGEFIPATAIIKDGKVIVQAQGIKKPVAVRYCFDNTTIGTIFTKEGLPITPFRTDLRTSILK